DIHRGITKIRVIEHINRIHANLEFFCFTYPDAFDEIGIEADLPRTFDPVLPHSPDSAYPRIRHNNAPLRIGNSELRVCCLGVRGCGDARSAGIRHSRESIEVCNAARRACDCNFPAALREWSNKIRKIVGVREQLKRTWSGAVGGERKWLAGTP